MNMKAKNIIFAAMDVRGFSPESPTSGRNLNRKTSTHSTKVRTGF